MGTLQLKDSVEFLGPVFGEAKQQLLDRVGGFILPSLSEGLPMTVLEAWANELPVIMTEMCNLPEGFRAQAAIRIEPTPDSIARGLRDFFAFSTDRRYNLGIAAVGLSRIVSLGRASRTRCMMSTDGCSRKVPNHGPFKLSLTANRVK